MHNNKPIDISPFRHLYPFQSHYMDLNGFKYHYLDDGAGEPIIMIHGNPTWSFYYRKLVKELAPLYRTIVPDHIGCGLSDKPDVHQYDFLFKNRVADLKNFINYLDLEDKLTLVVHDWGGAIGMAYAVNHPEKIGRMIITNTAAFLLPKKKSIPFRLWLIRNISPFATPAVLGCNVFSLAALYMAPHKKLTPDVKKGLTAPYNCWKNRIATLKFVQDIPLTKDDQSYDLLKAVDENLHKLSHIPMLILWGMHDFVFDKSYLNEWERRFPNAEIHRFSDAGHYLLEDVPEKISSLAIDFLARHSIH